MANFQFYTRNKDTDYQNAPQFVLDVMGTKKFGNGVSAGLVLGTIQTVISVGINAVIALTAGSIAMFLGTRPTWLLVQRWLMGTVLAGLVPGFTDPLATRLDGLGADTKLGWSGFPTVAADGAIGAASATTKA